MYYILVAHRIHLAPSLMCHGCSLYPLFLPHSSFCTTAPSHTHIFLNVANKSLAFNTSDADSVATGARGGEFSRLVVVLF